MMKIKYGTNITRELKEYLLSVLSWSCIQKVSFIRWLSFLYRCRLRAVFYRNEPFSVRKFKWVALIAIFFIGCSTSKNIPENDALFTGAVVEITQTDISPKHKKALERNIKQLVKPKPNSKILGLPFKLWMYNLGSEKGVGGWIRRKFGQEPVLFSRLNVKNTEELLDNYLENRGFFQVFVASESTVANKKAKVRFEVKTGPEYKIKKYGFSDGFDSFG